MRQYNSEIIGYINVFENITRAKVKDCYLNRHLVFIVEQGEIGKAIGKNGSNVKRVSNLLKKSVRVVEFNNKVEIFIKNMIMPIRGKIYKEEESDVVIELGSNTDRANVLGKNKQNLKELKEVVNRYFDAVDIKVK